MTIYLPADQVGGVIVGHRVLQLHLHQCIVVVAGTLFIVVADCLQAGRVFQEL